MKATCIKWDTDGNAIALRTLPTEIEIPNELINGDIDYDKIDNYLSDVTGYCHFGYVFED